MGVEDVVPIPRHLKDDEFFCPNCGRICNQPTLEELGDSDRRGYYCSIECKLKYIGSADQCKQGGPLR